MTLITTVSRPDGAELAVMAEGEGPAVMLVSGLGGTVAFWSPVVPYLARSNRVIRLDQRGIGASSRGAAPCTIDVLAEDCVAVADALGFGPLLFVGHSTGGCIGQAFARMAPDRLNGLVLSGAWLKPSRYMAALFGARQIMLDTDPALYAATGALLGFAPAWLEANWGAYEAAIGQPPATETARRIVRERIDALIAFDGSEAGRYPDAGARHGGARRRDRPGLPAGGAGRGVAGCRNHAAGRWRALLPCHPHRGLRGVPLRLCVRAAVTGRRVAVIGFGAIGRDLAAALLAHPDGPYEVAVLLASGSASRARVPAACHLVGDVAGLAAFRPALVVEAASAAAVRDLGPSCLSLGVPLLLSSVGALHDDALRETLVAAATRFGTRLYLPSGALAGLDYVRAARGAARPRVAYESRKPPAAWRDELVRLGLPAEPVSPVTLYDGDAGGAAARYPANLNVAATLALAGPGFDETRVAVVVDPAASGNTHRVTVESEYGTLEVNVRNMPSPENPKTSWIVSRSLLAAIEQHFSVVVML